MLSVRGELLSLVTLRHMQKSMNDIPPWLFVMKPFYLQSTRCKTTLFFKLLSIIFLYFLQLYFTVCFTKLQKCNVYFIQIFVVQHIRQLFSNNTKII